jgi:uncharacterized phage protein gp47/JayE
MALDTLPAEIDIPSRDEEKSRVLRDMKFRGPTGLDTSQGTQPDIDADLIVDVVVPLYAIARRAGNNLIVSSATGTALEEHARLAGLPSPYLRPPAGASGTVVVVAATSGGVILVDTELREPQSGVRFRVTRTDTYQDGDSVPVTAVDKGLNSNFAIGTVLQFTSPPPGIGPNATVEDDGEGNGLTGGRGEETNEELVARIIDRRANPPASGNDAAIREAAVSCPDVSVEACFTYPAWAGPGTVAAVFTKRPSEPGGDRIPDAFEIATVSGWVQSQFPYDDSIFFCQVAPQPVDVSIGVTWRDDAEGWADTSPFPNYLSGTNAIKVTVATSATVFTLSNTSLNFSGSGSPAIGKSIALWDSTNKVFVKKKILSFTGSGPWVVTVDTALGVSDSSFVPAVGDRAMPWSESLNTLQAPVISYFDTLGPGEQFATFFDDGRRQRRSPKSPRQWSFTVGNRLVVGVLDVDTVGDAEIVEPSVPTDTTVGTAGVFSYLMQLDNLSVFPQT